MNNDEIKLLFMRLETFRWSFLPYALKLWNLLSIQDRAISCAYNNNEKPVIVLYSYCACIWLI